MADSSFVWLLRPLKGAVHAFLALSAVCLIIPSALAATPREELLRLVPDDVAFCVVLQDLRDHAARLQKSPFLEQFSKTPLAKFLESSKDLEKLFFLDTILKENLGVNSSKLLEDIFGDAAVFAYRPGPSGQPETEQGLFLVRSRDEKALSDLIERLNAVQKQSGDVKEISPRIHKGVTYQRRLEKKGENFYWQRGPLLAVSTQEAMLHQVIDLDRSERSAKEPFLANQFRQLGADKQLLAFWLNPRAFQEEIKRKAVGNSAEATGLRTYLSYWQALEGIALTVDLQDDLVITVAARARPDGLPASARRFFAEAGKPTELWRRIPSDALLGAAGRVDVLAFAEAVAEFLTPEMRQTAKQKLDRSVSAAWDKDLLKDILPCLGPDWAFYVAFPPDNDKNWFPHMVAAYRVTPGSKDPPIDKTILEGLTSLARLGVLAYNAQADSEKEGTLQLKTTKQDGVLVYYLTGSSRFPPGFQPAWGLRDEFLILASSPDAIGQFRSKDDKALSTKTGEIPILKLSITETCRFLKVRREPLVAFLAEKNQLAKEVVAQQLDALVAVLQIFDWVEVTQLPGEGQAVLTLRVKTVKPLK
ncbi:MAG: hypothetical protein ACJ8FY_09545 [Gemmataceae bacterium]